MICNSTRFLSEIQFIEDSINEKRIIKKIIKDYITACLQRHAFLDNVWVQESNLSSAVHVNGSSIKISSVYGAVRKAAFLCEMRPAE